MQAEPAQAKRPFQAQAEVPIANPEHIIARVFEHFAGHDAEITPIERGSSAAFFLGEVSMQAVPDNVVMHVTADDDIGVRGLTGRRRPEAD